MKDSMNFTEDKTNKDPREQIQKFGRFLSGMVMPNIGAFIAWGLITALFIPTGWIPNEKLATLVGPMIVYLLPLLIGYTGGRAVGGARGGVIGAVATMGVIVGADVPMFIGAMIVGPLGGYVINKLDNALEEKIPAGFEMLVNNFSAGIVGMGLALLAYLAIGPVVLALNGILKAEVEAIVNTGLLPLASLFVEPGKILFLNNAMNHGVLGPLGIQEVNQLGKSIFFLIETNPGPGLGILLAYWMFAKGSIKESAPGAIIIHFLGGIHEIYFPYVLMNPLLILAVIAGGAGGVLTFSVLGAGLVATPSPGSIFALLTMTPKGGYFAVLAGVAVSTGLSFLVASVLVKRSSVKQDVSALQESKERVLELKGNMSRLQVKKIIFACDAGMGSSAMAGTAFRSKLKNAGIDIEVINTSVDDIPANAELVITHTGLTARAMKLAKNAEHVSIIDYFNDPKIDELIARLKSSERNVKEEISEEKDSNSILRKTNIRLGLKSVDKAAAIKMAGEILVEGGYVKEEYIAAMLEREEQLSTYIGNGVAIPHGVGKAKNNIIKSGMVVLQFPEGINFGNDIAHLVIGIAGVGNEHLSILANIATAIEDEARLDILNNTNDAEEIYRIFTTEQ